MFTGDLGHCLENYFLHFFILGDLKDGVSNYYFHCSFAPGE